MTAFYDKIKNHRKLFYYSEKKNQEIKERKEDITATLFQEYDIQSAEDIQDTLKDLLGGTIQEMLEVEMETHLGYEAYKRFKVKGRSSKG